MTPEANDWKPRSGGAFDDIDATIIAARFGEPPEAYQAKATITGATAEPMLYVTLESPTLEYPFEQGYSCGGQWEIAGGGKEVINTKDPDEVRFTESSRAGLLASRVATIISNGGGEDGFSFMAKRGRMTQAESYVGLNFHWKQEARETRQGQSSNVLLPSKFLGTSEKAPEDTPATGITDEDIAEIIELSSDKTEKELKAAILKHETLSKNNTLKTAVFNKGLLAKLVSDGKLTVFEDKYV